MKSSELWNFSLTCFMFCFPSFLQRINLSPSLCFLEKSLVCVCVSICLYTCVHMCVCACVCVCVLMSVSFFMHTGCVCVHILLYILTRIKYHCPQIRSTTMLYTVQTHFANRREQELLHDFIILVIICNLEHF